MYGTISDCYCTNDTTYLYYNKNIGIKTGVIDKEVLKGYAKNLGNEFIEDGKKLDKNEDIVDNLDKNGNIIYINNGYPILKWQIE